MPTHCKACENTDSATKTLTDRGVRLTVLRRDVLQELHHAKQPLGAYDLFDNLKSAGKASAPPAVYRVLDFLVEQGLAHKLRSLSAYAACCLGPHAHQAIFLICRSCGTVNECDIAAPKSLTDTAKSTGFRIEDITIEAMGTCRSCTEAPN
ncbi:MAG: transcriptional repressor [Rhodobacteraceae bacterium]|nr:transcriptional repressor [Paracoccaceae bacterium]